MGCVTWSSVILVVGSAVGLLLMLGSAYAIGRIDRTLNRKK